VITAGVAGTAWTLKRLYPTPAGRAALAGTAGANPALRFLYGRLDGTSLGSITTWRYGVWAGLFAALVAIFVVIRHTRSDEEAGRLELAGSTVVGRQAALVAALATAAAGVLAVSVLLCAVLPLTGLPASGSVLLALGIGCCGLAFTGIAAPRAGSRSACWAWPSSCGAWATRRARAGRPGCRGPRRWPGSSSPGRSPLRTPGCWPSRVRPGRVDRAGPGGGDQPVRPGAAAVPLDPGRLAVHSRAAAAGRPGAGCPLLWLCAVALALSAAGLAALRRRDIG
jgi:hypothetical protein